MKAYFVTLKIINHFKKFLKKLYFISPYLFIEYANGSLFKVYKERLYEFVLNMNKRQSSFVHYRYLVNFPLSSINNTQIKNLSLYFSSPRIDSSYFLVKYVAQTSETERRDLVEGEEFSFLLFLSFFHVINSDSTARLIYQHS